ncbi:hypothetical protein F2Q70_00012000 [Brassica cretica]|uniref:Uncharacterized protein n=1 Tax=Brassica cretica TaxID=69181 RepID=A0A8S9M5X6_BRACR|nr:hypothetical protein F2Q70_00012000 [Brassica cretica]
MTMVAYRKITGGGSFPAANGRWPAAVAPATSGGDGGMSRHRSMHWMRIDRLFFLSSTSTWSARVKCPLSSKMLQSHSFTPKCT